MTIGLLLTAIAAGLIWHFGRYRRKYKKTKETIEALSRFNLVKYFMIGTHQGSLPYCKVYDIG